MQPLVIDLKGKKVVFAGGGKIAARKAKVLEAEQADITFIAPDFSNEVLKLSQKNGYTLIKRKAELADFNKAVLVVLATNDRKENQELAKSLAPYQLVCVTDESGEGNVIFPATLRRGHLQIAVSTNGASPKLTRELKEELEARFDESWETYIDFLAQCRRIIKRLPLPSSQKNEFLRELLDERYRTEENSRTEVLQELNLILSNENKEI